MKNSMLVFAPLCLLSAAAVCAAGPSVERGKVLFGSAALGTSGKSCESCHPGGARLTEAAEYSPAELKKIINTCISKPLKGNKLAEDSDDMESLVLYIQSLKQAKK